MQNHILDAEKQAKLRERALSRLTSTHIHGLSRASASQAMGVLHQLASSPETAGDALALLHEMQVHQVELEVQEEELRKSREEIEARLGRHAQLFDFSPVGCFTIDRQMAIGEINLAGARLLGHPREEITGKNIANYIGPESGRLLADLLKAGVSDDDVQATTLQVLTAAGKLKTVRAAVGADPAGHGIVIAVIDFT